MEQWYWQVAASGISFILLCWIESLSIYQLQPRLTLYNSKCLQCGITIGSDTVSTLFSKTHISLYSPWNKCLHLTIRPRYWWHRVTKGSTVFVKNMWGILKLIFDKYMWSCRKLFVSFCKCVSMTQTFIVWICVCVFTVCGLGTGKWPHFKLCQVACCEWGRGLFETEHRCWLNWLVLKKTCRVLSDWRRDRRQLVI